MTARDKMPLTTSPPGSNVKYCLFYLKFSYYNLGMKINVIKKELEISNIMFFYLQTHVNMQGVTEIWKTFK